MSTTQPKFERLFSPLQVGPMRVPNRICETTNTIGAGRLDGLPDEAFTAHHAAKAHGGTGWIGSETWLLNSPLPNDAADEFFPGAASTRFPLYLLPGFVERMQTFCDEVHSAGSVVVSQLTHLSSTFGPSPVTPVEIYDWIPHQLDKSEIEFVVNTYVTAAGQLRAGGVDGIEIHCAHETLPHLFLSPATNQRSDAYGGDAYGRTRFVIEVLEGVRSQIGNDTALGIRMGGFETRKGGYDLLQMREMLSLIAEAGLIDFVNVDVGSSSGVLSYVQPSFYGHGEFREIGKAVKADVGDEVAVLFAGRVNDPVVAEELLAQKACDLVGMTRAGIADPEFANKARDGRLIEMRRCIGCNRCIGETIHSYAPIMMKRPVCSVNPVVGNEIMWKMMFRPAENARQVVVVGGGPAGLEAARVAAMRGHQVTLLERASALGGQIRLAAKAPGRDSFEDLVYFQENEMVRLGVDVRLDVDVDADAVMAFHPDAVICATGSRPIHATEPGMDSPNVVLGWDVLAGRVTVGERVAVVSREDHFETPAVADFLAAMGKRVEIFHKWTALGREIDRYSIGVVMRRLEEGGVKIHTGLQLDSFAEGQIEFVSSYTSRTIVHGGFDTVVIVYGSAPDTSLHDALRGRVQRQFLCGSAWVPRQIAEATQHGMKVGMEV